MSYILSIGFFLSIWHSERVIISKEKDIEFRYSSKLSKFFPIPRTLKLIIFRNVFILLCFVAVSFSFSVEKYAKDVELVFSNLGRLSS